LNKAKIENPKLFQHLSHCSVDKSISCDFSKVNMSVFTDEGITLKFKEYHYKGFDQIRKASMICNEEFIKSFDPSLNHKIFKKQLSNKTAGKSGKSIIMTHDKKFILKEIEVAEKHTLCKNAEKYVEFITENSNTLLARIYGLFSLKLPHINKVHFIIMQNFDFFA
jgi:1-phosphatidylinositol-4-phosphate 5-kinase